MNEARKITAEDPNDPSVAFGQDQGRFVYGMASSLTAHTDRPIIERAQDAVQTAIRIFERPEVEIELATAGLVAALEGNFTISDSKE